MQVLDDSRINPVVESLHHDNAKIIWAMGSKNRVSTVGHSTRPVIGLNTEIMVLGDKERLYAFVPHLQPLTFLGKPPTNPDHPYLKDSCGYYEKPATGSCGRGIVYHPPGTFLIDQWENPGYILQQEVPCTLKDGYKFDIRLWVALCESKKFWIAPSAMARVCLFKDTSMSAHITNLSYCSSTSSSSVETIRQDFEESGKIYKKAKRCAKLFCTILQKRIDTTVLKRPFLWTLVGMDIAVDRFSGLPWLLEINTAPTFDGDHHSPWFVLYRKWLCSLLEHIHSF